MLGGDGDLDGQASPRGKNWRGRDHGSMIVRTVGLLPIRENRSCLDGVLRTLPWRGATQRATPSGELCHAALGYSPSRYIPPRHPMR